MAGESAGEEGGKRGRGRASADMTDGHEHADVDTDESALNPSRSECADEEEGKAGRGRFNADMRDGHEDAQADSADGASKPFPTDGAEEMDEADEAVRVRVSVPMANGMDEDGDDDDDDDDNIGQRQFIHSPFGRMIDAADTDPWPSCCDDHQDGCTGEGDDCGGGCTGEGEFRDHCGWKLGAVTDDKRNSATGDEFVVRIPGSAFG